MFHPACPLAEIPGGATKHRPDPAVMLLLGSSLVAELEQTPPRPTSRPALPPYKIIESLSNLPPDPYLAARALSTVLSNNSCQLPQLGLFESAFGCTPAAENGYGEFGLEAVAARLFCIFLS